VLDPALLRPGRFDRRVVVGVPTCRAAKQILRCTPRKSAGDDVDLSVWRAGHRVLPAPISRTGERSCADRRAQNRKVVMMSDFELAKDKVMMGAERKSLVIHRRREKNTAYHEAGHALVAALTPDSDPLHKVTIIPRGWRWG
jgi:cell division protease FtsH